MARQPKSSNDKTEDAAKAEADTPREARSFSAETKLAELSLSDLTAIMRQEIAGALASVQRPGGVQGVHVNSGPPGFVNGGGHANFDPAGAHVNSGPPGFTNGTGHANFDPDGSLTSAGQPQGVHVNSGPPGFVNGSGHANFDPSGSHVNSGPPGFVNGGGHANFDPSGSFTSAGQPQGVHVNSGPPGFVNGGGHANFDPSGAFRNPQRVDQATKVTLPGGLQVDVPAGRFDMTIRGTRIKR